jgi:hypothetical protein
MKKIMRKQKHSRTFKDQGVFSDGVCRSLFLTDCHDVEAWPRKVAVEAGWASRDWLLWQEIPVERVELGRGQTEFQHS